MNEPKNPELIIQKAKKYLSTSTNQEINNILEDLIETIEETTTVLNNLSAKGAKEFISDMVTKQYDGVFDDLLKGK